MLTGGSGRRVSEKMWAALDSFGAVVLASGHT